MRKCLPLYLGVEGKFVPRGQEKEWVSALETIAFFRNGLYNKPCTTVGSPMGD